jgi:SAM-dependent methyltransferase
MMPPVMPTLTARNADRHALYETAVQQPIAVIQLIERLLGARRHEPLTLREDFCGTAFLSATWVRSGPDRRAVAVDADRRLIAYARRRHQLPLGAAAGRLRLAHARVLNCRARADVVASLNFSHYIHHDRAALLRYFRHVRRVLRPGGLFLLDSYGGPGAIAPCTDRRDYGDFTYLWQQESFDPLTHRVVNRIHFRFRDGSTIRDAFTYNWRLWSVAELREALHETGFSRLRACYESERGFVERIDPSAHDAWVAYLSARR